MYNSFYLLYVENQKNYKEQKRKKEAPYLLNKTPTTNWFLYLSYSISISLKTNASLYHHYSPPHIYTTKKTDDYINLATNLHLEKKKKTKRNSQCCKTDKRTMRMMLSAYEKMIHKRCDDYICT